MYAAAIIGSVVSFFWVDSSTVTIYSRDVRNDLELVGMCKPNRQPEILSVNAMGQILKINLSR